MSPIKEKVIHFFVNYNEYIEKNMLTGLIKLIFVMMVIATSMLTQDLYAHIQRDNDIKITIQDTLNNMGETVLDQTEQGVFEFEDGPSRTFRVYGDENTYIFYFDNDTLDTPSVYNETQDEWATSEPAIPVNLTAAFVSFGVGMPESFIDGTVSIGEETYTVSHSPYRVEIDDLGSYAPLPLYSRRKTKFIEQYIGAPVKEIEVVNLLRMPDYELVYVEHDEKYYRLRIYFDDTADASLITGGFDLIETGSSNN